MTKPDIPVDARHKPSIHRAANEVPAFAPLTLRFAGQERGYRLGRRSGGAGRGAGQRAGV